MNVFKVKCLISMAIATMRNGLRNELLCLRTDVKREIVCRVDRSILRWLSYMGKNKYILFDKRSDEDRGLVGLLVSKVLRVKED